jgi:predicted nucleic acid-binding protein
MSVLIDTNIVLDVVADNSAFRDWASEALTEALQSGEIIINPIVYAELAPAFRVQAFLDAFLTDGSFLLETIPWSASFRTGEVYKTYLERGGTRTAPLADFFIGAHAEVQSYALMTRDISKYRSYFPSVPLITPETHPQ